MSGFKDWVETAGLIIEGTGVLAIVIGILVALGRYVWSGVRGEQRVYQQFRQDLGRGILLGLEFLVAGDIIRTVAVDPTLENVAVLAVIVLVRTFLSLSIQVELEGRLPWQPKLDASP